MQDACNLIQMLLPVNFVNGVCLLKKQDGTFFTCIKIELRLLCNSYA